VITTCIFLPTTKRLKYSPSLHHTIVTDAPPITHLFSTIVALFERKMHKRGCRRKKTLRKGRPTK